MSDPVLDFGPNKSRHDAAADEPILTDSGIRSLN